MASTKKKKDKHLIAISVLILFAVSVGVFFCIKSYINKQKNKSTLITNTITMNYTDDYNGIMVPATSIYNDTDGKIINTKENIFDFVVSSRIKSSTKTKYNLVLEKDKTSNIPNDKVKIYLESSKDDKFVKPKVEVLPTKFKENNGTNKMLLKSITLSKNAKIYYRLRVWIDDSYMSTNPNDYFKANVNINAK